MKERQFMPGEKWYTVKVDQPGPTLYVHPLGNHGYQVFDRKVGAAMWRTDGEAIRFIKQLQKITGRKFKVEVIEQKQKPLI
jgi:hypothetical protein